MSASNQGLSPSDLEEAFRIFDEEGIPRSRARFQFNEAGDCWCLHDAADDSVVASRNPPPDAVEWVKA